MKNDLVQLVERVNDFNGEIVPFLQNNVNVFLQCNNYQVTLNGYLEYQYGSIYTVEGKDGDIQFDSDDVKKVVKRNDTMLITFKDNSSIRITAK